MGRVVVYHCIDTGDTHPIHKHPHRLLLAKKAEVDKMLKDMKGQQVCKETDSPWSLTIKLIRRKDRELRVCVDYQCLNDIT